MTAMRIVRALIGAAVVACLALPAAAQDQDPSDDITGLKAQLLQLKVNPYPPPRERAAQILVAIVRRMDVTTIDKATIDEIASLLDDKSDTVRGRMAIALGNIGEPAKYTVPALMKAFERSKEAAAEARNNPQASPMIRNYGLGTSADSICFALMKLEAFPPEGCLDGRYQTPQSPPSP
jgi:hypothetical protein